MVPDGRATKRVVLIAVLLQLTGCGLLRFESDRMVPDPNPPVSIVDQASGKRIAGASLLAGYWPFENWTRELPAGDWVMPDHTTLEVARDTSGVFHIVPVRVTTESRPVWLISPTGTTIHKDYGVTLIATAPGYRAAAISWYPGAPPGPGRIPHEVARSVGFDSGGALVFRLEAEPMSGTSR